MTLLEENPKLRKKLDGYLVERGKCELCHQCWIYAANQKIAKEFWGRCIYGGPFIGKEYVE
jgi:ferredoxin